MSESYRALGYHPSLPDGRAGGRILVEPDGLRFLAEGSSGAAWMPFDQMQIKLVGMNNDQPEFRHSAAEGWVVICHEKALLNHPRLKSEAVLRRELYEAARSRPWTGLAKACLLLLSPFVLLLGLLWIFREPIISFIVNQIPVTIEKDIGDAAWEQMKLGEKILTKSPYQAQLDSVTKQLLPHIKAEHSYDFKFHIAEDDDTVNAYALPGGHIVVYTRLLKAIKRPEQLAGVLAHEMAHVTERHALRNLVSKLGLSSLLGLLVGDANTLTALISGSSEMLIGQKFSREAETQADDLAWDTLVRARLDPRGLREFFELLQEEERKAMGGLMSGALSWVSTHPATSERITRLREREAAL